MNGRSRRFATQMWRALKRKLTAMQVTALVLAAGVGHLLSQGQWPPVALLLPALALTLAVDSHEETPDA